MIAVTVCIASLFIVTAIEVMHQRVSWFERGNLLAKQVCAISAVTIWLVLGMTLVMSVWATLLQVLGVFEYFEESLYFSMISFTTLGFGDLILPEPWRLLSGFVAIDGFIIFGLNTAFLFEVIRRLRVDIYD